MSRKSRTIPTVLALILSFAVTQVYLGASVAGSRSASGGKAAAPQQAGAVLTTAGGKPISVNGADATTGATIVSGALVETPGLVTATINIPGHAMLDISADTKLTLEFDQNGNPKVMLREGCVTLHTTKGTTGEIDTSAGVAGKTDPAKDGVLRVCFPRGATAPTVGAGGAGGGGLGGGAIAAIVIGGTGAAIGIGLGLRGDNPTPATP